MSRRDVLLAAVAALPLAGCRHGPGPELPWSLGSEEGLEPGTWVERMRRVPGRPDGPALGGVFVRRERDGALRALDRRCGCRPREGRCPPRWLGAAKRFVCPCHAGIYDKDGRPLGGAEQALEPLDVRVHDGTIYISASRR